MQKTRLLSILTVGLLLSNIALVAFILMGRPGKHDGPPRGGPGGPRRTIIERLHFTREQVAAYDKLITAHRAAVEEADKSIIELKNELYATLTGKPGNADSIVTAIASVQHEMEYVHYRHFQDIKQLCRGEQQKDFELLAPELASLFAPPRHKHK